MKHFHSLDDINWSKLALLLGAVAVFWAGLAEILPPEYYTIGLTVLTALGAAVGFITHGGKKPKE